MKPEELDNITTNEIDFRSASYLEGEVMREFPASLNILVKVKAPVKMYQILSCDLVYNAAQKTMAVLNWADGKWYDVEDNDDLQALIEEMATAL